MTSPTLSAAQRSQLDWACAWYFEQIGLALLVFLLYVLWLRMPDASVLDVVGSVVLALIILAVAGAGESAIMLRVAGPCSHARETLARHFAAAGWRCAVVGLGRAARASARQ